MASTYKETGNPTFPPTVRRAERIPNEILSKVNAASLGIEPQYYEWNDVIIDSTTKSTLGARIDARATHTAGLTQPSRARQKTHDFVSSVIELASKLGGVAESFMDN